MQELTLNQENFQSLVLEETKPVLVDFWASWCGPCRSLAPVISGLAQDHAETLVVGKVNVDEEPELAARYQIQSIPALILFQNGEPTQTSVGFRSKAQLEAMLGL